MEELTRQIEEVMEAFKTDSAKFLAGNKAAGARARKSTNLLTKMMKTWRAESVKR